MKSFFERKSTNQPELPESDAYDGLSIDDEAIEEVNQMLPTPGDKQKIIDIALEYINSEQGQAIQASGNHEPSSSHMPIEAARKLVQFLELIKTEDENTSNIPSYKG
jgi:hypothetical protein